MGYGVPGMSGYNNQSINNDYELSVEQSSTKRRRIIQDSQTTITEGTGFSYCSSYPETLERPRTIFTSSTTKSWSYAANFDEAQSQTYESLYQAKGLSYLPYETDQTARSRYMQPISKPESAFAVESHTYSFRSDHQQSAAPINFSQGSYYDRSFELSNNNILQETPKDDTSHVDAENLSHICFGMVSVLAGFTYRDILTLKKINDLEATFDIFPQNRPERQLTASFSPPHTLVIADTFHKGTLNERSANILQAFSDDPLIDVQLILSLTANEHTKRKRHAPHLQRCRVPVSVSVIVYGADSVFDDIGTFCQQADLYLQDPVGADRNVQYRNPHRLSSAKDEICMTFDLHKTKSNLIITQVHISDFLDAFVSSQSLQELETPLNMRTQLMPYVTTT